MFFILLGLFIAAFYYYGIRNHRYWEKKGVVFEKPLFLVGSSLKQFIDRVSVSERFAALYYEFPKERFVGFFDGNSPGILIRDPDIIRHILNIDFAYFRDRGLNLQNKVVEPLMKNLFTVDGDVWKIMRKNLTPTFSSGKLKAMFPLIVERTEKLAILAAEAAETREEVDVRELMARYTTDFIGACGFGLDSIALNDPDSDFRKLGKRIFTVTVRDHFIALIKRTAPETLKNVHFFAPEIEKKVISIIRQIMTERDFKPTGRNDFIDMMLELKQKGKLSGESMERTNSDGSPQTVELMLDDQLLAAQVFIFFAAGFETSSSASSFLLHMLAYHPEVQERCQKEIDEVLQRYNGNLCFDAVREMKYLEMAFRESIRCLPSPGFLIRKSVAKYTIPGTNVTLDENMPVIISTQGLSSDEQYFEEPEKFIPERFHPDNVDKIKNFTFMPFGEGPRACIGERMGIMQSMAGVATLLRSFTVSPSRSSVQKPRIDPNSLFVQTILGGLPLALNRRKS